MFQAPPELPAVGSTTSYSSSSSEKITKSFSSSTKETFSSDTQAISLPPLQAAPIQLYQSPTPAQQPQSFPPPKQQQQAPQQTFPPKSASQSFLPKQVPVQVVKQASSYQNASPPTVVAQSTKISPAMSESSVRSGLNASPVTPGIHKKHVQLNAAVPIPPYGTNGNHSKSPVQFSKSPVPFVNTTPTPFGFPLGQISTPETVAQTPIRVDPLVPKYSAQKPLPLIVPTTIPHYDNNYNLAARGWGVCPDYYRPVILSEAAGLKLIPPQTYTDF